MAVIRFSFRQKIARFWANAADFWRKLAKMAQKLVVFVAAIAEDLLVLAGLAVIVGTNFRVNELLGWYSLGVVLLGIGLLLAFLARRPR